LCNYTDIKIFLKTLKIVRG